MRPCGGGLLRQALRFRDGQPISRRRDGRQRVLLVSQRRSIAPVARSVPVEQAWPRRSVARADTPACGRMGSPSCGLRRSPVESPMLGRQRRPAPSELQSPAAPVAHAATSRARDASSRGRRPGAPARRAATGSATRRRPDRRSGTRPSATPSPDRPLQQALPLEVEPPRGRLDRRPARRLGPRVEPQLERPVLVGGRVGRKNTRSASTGSPASPISRAETLEVLPGDLLERRREARRPSSRSSGGSARSMCPSRRPRRRTVRGRQALVARPRRGRQPRSPRDAARRHPGSSGA